MQQALVMCCGGSVLFSEFFFLVLYVLTAPALTLSSGPGVLLHLYIIYTGYSFIGLALSSLSPFLREVIQVCLCGVMLVCYPLNVIPEPILSLLTSLLFALAPLLCLVEGYQIYLLITRLSRFLVSQIEERDEDDALVSLTKASILAASLLSILLSVYLSTLLDLCPVLKLSLLGLAALFVLLNVYVDEGIISDSCLIVALSYLLLTITLNPLTPTPPPTLSTASQAQTMLGAITRIPHLVSYSVQSALPFAKQLLAPLPLVTLAVRVICVASFADSHLKEESWARGLGKFLVVSLYTSYVLGVTQPAAWAVPLSQACRAAEVALMVSCYLRYLLGFATELDDYEF